MQNFLKILQVFCVLCCIDVISGDGDFIISGSKVIRENSSYEVSITTFGYDTECCPKLQLTIKAGADDQQRYKEMKIVNLQNNTTTNVKFDLHIPKELTTYVLEAKTVTGPYLQRSVLLHKAKKYFTVFIQTDKSTYKPSDVVQFRVLVLDQETKPFSPSSVDIFISDSEKNRLKQFLNVSLTNGVYKNQFQLFDSAALGEWLITVKVNKDKSEEKSFKVAKYVLPKFQVSIVTDPFLSTKDETLKVTVLAKYTHGKSVKGNAVVTLRRSSYETSTKNVNVNGKATIEFHLKNDLKLISDEYYYDVDLDIEVKFTEELTGNEQTTKSSKKIYADRNNIEIVFENGPNFKPGLPLRFHIEGKTKDGKPISDEVNQVRITITIWKNPIEQYCNQSLDETTHNLTMKNGLAPFEIIPSKDVGSIDIKAEYLKGSAEKEVLVKESKSREYMQLRVDTKRPSLNDIFTVHTETTNEITELIYQITNRGQIIETKFLEFPKTKMAKFDVDVTFPMIPQSKINAFYFRPNGEVISDEITVDFADNLPNYIDFELSKYEVKPDTTVDITLKTNPFSFVGLLGVDQSSLLIGSNDLKLSQIFDQLNEYNSVDEYNNDEFAILELSDDDYANIDDHNFMDKFEFDNSKSFIITNRIFNPNDSRDADQSGDNVDTKSITKKCSHRYLSSTKSACCPLTKGNIETEETDIDYLEYDKADEVQYMEGGLESYSDAHSTALSFNSFITDRVADFESTAIAFNANDENVYFGQSAQVPEPFGESHKGRPGSRSSPKFEIRKSFIETWFFDDILLDENDNGTKTLSKTVPSEITSWIITGFSLNPTIGLGVSTKPTKLGVFQPFFVSVNLPYSVKRGEVVAIQATVFNFQKFELPVDITLHNENSEFEFVDIDENENDLDGKASKNLSRTKREMVPFDDGVSSSFMIRPLIVGHITIKVVATSPVAGDGLERMLLVEPEGVTKYINKVVFIDLKDSNETSTSTSIAVPANAVSDSTKIEVGIVGDVMGPTIENLQKLIKLPYGCGEQNMLNFVPNIVVLNYLTTVNKLTPDIQKRLIKYLETGYQRELQFRHENGSYSAFGRTDASGSTWLTAFVVKSFGEASKFIAVDDDVVKKALDFLKSIQHADGHFPEVGYVIHKDMQGGSSNGIGLTSYTLMSFLENKKYLDEYKDTVDKALKFITENLNSINDTYSLSIVAYTLQLADHPKKNEMLEKLQSKAEQGNGEMFWSKGIPMKPKFYDITDDYYQQPKTLDVEMTAYALRSFVTDGKIQDAIPIMKWLLKQRNENGGFQSTQDTVVGLQALASLAQKIYSIDATFNVSVKTDKDSDEKIFQVNAENALLLQREEINQLARVFDISATGRGFGLLQVSYKYNVNETADQPKFVLKPRIQDSSKYGSMNLEVCVNYVPSMNDIVQASNMAVMEVSLPSGYTLDVENISSLEEAKGVKKVETKRKDTIAIIYFNSIDETENCLQVKALRTTKIANQKPAFVTVYDYYDNSCRVTEFYDPPTSTLCDICEGEDCKVCEKRTIKTE